MSSTREDLPDAIEHAGDDLDFTAEALLNELAGYFYQKRQPGDITVEQVKAYFNVGNDTARKKLYDLARQGVLEKVKVYGESGHPITVYRKRKP